MAYLSLSCLVPVCSCLSRCCVWMSCSEYFPVPCCQPCCHCYMSCIETGLRAPPCLFPLYTQCNLQLTLVCLEMDCGRNVCHTKASVEQSPPPPPPHDKLPTWFTALHEIGTRRSVANPPRLSLLFIPVCCIRQTGRVEPHSPGHGHKKLWLA